MARVWIVLWFRIAVLAAIAPPGVALAQDDAARWPRWIAALDRMLGIGGIEPAAPLSRAAPDPAPSPATPASSTPNRDAPPVQGQSPLTAVELVERLEDSAHAAGRGPVARPERGAAEGPLPPVAATAPEDRPAGVAAAEQRAEAQRLVRQIELLRTVPPYLSRRDLRVRGIRLPDEAIAQNREAALEAGRRWLAIAARLERESQLRAAVLELMGAAAFAEASGAIERAFLSEEALPGP
jgi:hypothetical protein